MFDCLAACNNVCVTCIWCMMLSTCYPKILGASGDNTRKCVKVPENDTEISDLLDCSLSTADAKVSPDPDNLKDSNCRRITIPRPASKKAI